MKKKNCGTGTLFSASLVSHILSKLRETWSPEQIAGRLFHELGPSYSTIYRWVYKGFIKSDLGVLRQKGKRQKPRETRGRFNIGLSISKRPSVVRGRETFGHWELNTVVSGRGQTKARVATFIERKSRFYIVLPMVDRSSHSMEHAIRTLHAYFPSGTFQTMTTDCGKEFSCHERIQDSLGIPMYFADPYSSWQRGSNENANGLLREFFPKGTNFGMINSTELSQEHSEIILRPDLAEKLHHLRDGIDVLTSQSSESIREQRLHPVFRCTLISIHSSPSIDHRVLWCLLYYKRRAQRISSA